MRRARRRSHREVEQFRLLQIFLSLCQTVAYAHSRGVLHRDLKPENVMIGPFGETLLLDWGIAKVLSQPEEHAGRGEATYVQLLEHGRETETQAGSILGTPSYMPPEIASGLTAEIDQRSDVYLLGGTLYEILTGQRPRTAKTALEMVKLAQQEPPIPALKVNADRARPSTPSAGRRWHIVRKTATRARSSWPRTSSDSSLVSPSRPIPKPFLARPGAGQSDTA